MAPDKSSAFAAIMAGNAVFWLAVLARARASARPGAARAVVARPLHAGLVLRLVVATNLMFYAVVLAGLVREPLAGPELWQPSAATATAGVALMLAALALIAWSFVVFRSWRVRAEIEEGHELMTGGPFALVRHPIYAGIIALFGSSFLLVPRLGFLLAVLVNVWSHDLRARTEEEALLDFFGSRYRSYMAHTKRLVPGVY